MDVDASAPPPQSYTILRIKRKRNEEPLDALGMCMLSGAAQPNIHVLCAVVESRVRRKKYRGGVGVFQYAHTVEGDAWKDEKSQKDIQVSHSLNIEVRYRLTCISIVQERISRLAKEDVVKLQEKPEVARPESEIPSSPIRSKKVQTPRYTIVSTDEQEPPTKRRVANL